MGCADLELEIEYLRKEIENLYDEKIIIESEMDECNTHLSELNARAEVVGSGIDALNQSTEYRLLDIQSGRFKEKYHQKVREIFTGADIQSIVQEMDTWREKLKRCYFVNEEKVADIVKEIANKEYEIDLIKRKIIEEEGNGKSV